MLQYLFLTDKYCIANAHYLCFGKVSEKETGRQGTENKEI